jgi:hypothetical protein
MNIGMDIILNSVIAVLLIVTIAYCWRLSKKISLLNSSKQDLMRFLDEFNSSISRAERNINELKQMGSIVDETLKQQIKKARFLANDLSFLTEKGEQIADNLEGRISENRTPPKRFVKDTTGNDVEINDTARKSMVNQAMGIQNISQKPKTTQDFKPIATKAPTMQTSSTDAKMPPSKRQALELVLSEIARRKNRIQENRDNQ